MFKHQLNTPVPGFGYIAGVKKGELEYEYLIIDKDDVVTWLSESDIDTILECNR